MDGANVLRLTFVIFSVTEVWKQVISIGLILFQSKYAFFFSQITNFVL